MSLANCTDCGKEVSTSAPSCPHCGRPFHQPANNLHGKGEGLFMQGLNLGCFVMVGLAVLMIALVLIGKACS